MRRLRERTMEVYSDVLTTSFAEKCVQTINSIRQNEAPGTNSEPREGRCDLITEPPGGSPYPYVLPTRGLLRGNPAPK